MSTDTTGSHPTFIIIPYVPTAGDRPGGPCRLVGPATVDRPWAGWSPTDPRQLDSTTVNNLFTVIYHK